ncbi:MAG TPA: hypothetical protein PK129_09760, partial [Cellvibrionaceae bacterium]|nr:hypothetical protein [Cellvibrionaceae bacterium]
FYARYTANGENIFSPTVSMDEIMRNPVLSIGTGRAYQFAYSNPYLNQVNASLVGAGPNVKFCWGLVGQCKEAKDFIPPPAELWSFDANSNIWVFNQRVNWNETNSEYFIFGILLETGEIKRETIHYTGYPTANRPSARDYCLPGSIAPGPCQPASIEIENLSTQGVLHLVVHTPIKSGWLSCFSDKPNGCSDMSGYKLDISPYENNEGWAWNESNKTWFFKSAWKDLKSGKYQVGVSNGREVFKTITIDFIQ